MRAIISLYLYTNPMRKEPSGEESKSDKLQSFYSRKNVPLIQELARRFEAEFSHIGEQVFERIDGIQQGTYTPTYKDRLDLFQVVSKDGEYMYRTILRCGEEEQWYIDTDSILGAYLEFHGRLDSLYGNEETDVIAGKAFIRQKHLHNFFYKLSLLHPVIGITNLLFYDYAKTNDRPCIKWYERILTHSESIIARLDGLREYIASQDVRAHTLNFIDDFINEVTLLIAEITHIAFQTAYRQDHSEIDRYSVHTLNEDGGMSYHGILQGEARSTKRPGILTSHIYFDEKKNHLRQQYANKLAHFYSKHQAYFGAYDLGPHSIDELSRKGAEKGAVMIPAYVESRDIMKFTAFLDEFITQITWALSGDVERMPTLPSHHDRSFRNGVSMIFRGVKNTMTDHDAPSAQARISFKYKGVKIRLDRDEERKKIILDYGEVDFQKALTMVDMLLTEYLATEGRHSPSLIDTRLVHMRNAAGSDSKKLEEVEEIEMNAKVALISSVVMLYGFSSFPLRKDLHSSYHSSEYVSGQQYYDNFAEIASDLDAIVTGKK